MLVLIIVSIKNAGEYRGRPLAGACCNGGGGGGDGACTLLARSTWEKGACQRKSLCIPSKLLEDEGQTAVMDQV